MDPQIHETTDDARSGETPRIVRYVLAFSLALAILALSAIWITGAFNSPEVTEADTLNTQTEAMR
ncbi:MAG: hypothetical protein KA533_06350 [Sphingobium sp.]|nr:hypothetical protein [Sphingobium sp.]MBP6112657.1 hypothetical protein [Sphingobium sp.]MBP8670548.1 hypothetical protein [Sphingobium sp.]MBP9157655.1 hypothetical protein [Sphingobium sp.]MCC6481508.1 hypothetical protein [Sphingomonadaceae bacterium]